MCVFKVYYMNASVPRLRYVYYMPSADHCGGVRQGGGFYTKNWIFLSVFLADSICTSLRISFFIVFVFPQLAYILYFYPNQELLILATFYQLSIAVNT